MKNQTVHAVILLIFSIALALFVNYVLPILFHYLDIDRFSDNIRLVFYLFSFIIYITVLFRSTDPYKKLPWLLFFLLWPEVAVILFLTFSRDFKQTRRYKRRRLMHGKSYIINEKEEPLPSSELSDFYNFSYDISGHPVYYNNSDTKLLNNGDETFPELIKRLKEAKKFILMEFYILKTDEIGKKVLDILKEKAENGLEVKLIVDYFGIMKAKKSYLKSLREAGVKIVIQDKIIIPIFNTKVNYRLHRKITIVDGLYAFTGGLNLGDEYNHQSKKYGFWRDTHLLVTGEAVKSLVSIYFKDWYYITGEMISDSKYYETKKVNVQGYVQAIQSGPDSYISIISDIYKKLIYNAKESVVIYTPYLAPSRSLFNAVRTAALGGVDVTLVLPGFPDKIIVYAITKSYLPSLLKAGVKVKMYKDTFVHSKVLIVDNKYASVGTFNFDQRSEHINFEDTVIMSNHCVHDLIKQYELDSEHCLNYTYKDYLKTPLVFKYIYALLNLLAPLS